MKNTAYGYEIKPRPTHLGGGWNVELTHDGTVVGIGVYPLEDNVDEIEAWNAASEFAEDWLFRRPLQCGRETLAARLFTTAETITLEEALFDAFRDAHAKHNSFLPRYPKMAEKLAEEMERIESIAATLGFGDNHTMKRRLEEERAGVDQ